MMKIDMDNKTNKAEIYLGYSKTPARFEPYERELVGKSVLRQKDASTTIITKLELDDLDVKNIVDSKNAKNIFVCTPEYLKKVIRKTKINEVDSDVMISEKNRRVISYVLWKGILLITAE